MRFKLKSSYRPTGDQPSAIKLLTKSLLSDNKHQTLLGVTGSGKTFTLANVIQNLQAPTLIISHNKTLAGQLYQEFRDYFPENAVSYFVSYYDYYQPESYLPMTDTYIEKETDINDEIDKLRLSATTNLLSRNDVIVVASVSCIYNLGSPLDYAKNFLTLTPGQVISPKSIMLRLVDMQYSKSDYDIRRGSFRERGDTITIWPANLDFALKLNFLDQTIETITPINPVSGVVIPDKQAHSYTFYPAKHYQGADSSLTTAVKQIKQDLAERLTELKKESKTIEAYRLAQKVKYDLEMIQEIGYVNGIENYSRYFDGRNEGDPPYTLLDYFQYNSEKLAKKPFLTFIDESHITIPQLHGMYAGDRSRKQTLIDYGFRLPSALDNRPLRFSEIIERLPRLVYTSATPENWELEQSGSNVAEQLIRPTALLDPQIRIKPIEGQIPDLTREIIKRFNIGQRVLVTTLTKKTAEALTVYLSDPANISKHAPVKKQAPSKFPQVKYLHSDVVTLDRSDILDDLRVGDVDVVVGINLLREGLDLPEVSLVAILDADKEGFLRSRTSLIQIMGRAARHLDGRVILYADKVTPSMKAAISEVERRRKIQLEYNLKHKIRPESIHKPIRDKLIERNSEFTPSTIPVSLGGFGWKSLKDIDPHSLTPQDKIKVKRILTKEMNQAAKAWEFERAAKIRDLISSLG
jgi:excinuclease ABC subunit B